MVRSVTDLDASRWSEHGSEHDSTGYEALEALEQVIRQGTAQMVTVLPMNWVRGSSLHDSVAGAFPHSSKSWSQSEPEKDRAARPPERRTR